MAPVSDIHSALFVPATLAHRVHKALASTADAVIVDLEDGVPESGKDEARTLAASALATRRRGGVVLRINAAGTPQFAEDVKTARASELDAVALPKTDLAALAALDADDLLIWALIETANGLHEAFEVAADRRVQRLLLGTVDLANDLGLEARDDGLELLFARSSVVVASRAAGIEPPLDGVCLQARNPEAVHREATLARSLGFGGKLCIHPDQLEPVHRAFAPSEEQLAWARSVVAASEAAYAAGLGAVVVDGSMVDRPVVNRARRLLETAEGRFSPQPKETP